MNYTSFPLLTKTNHHKNGEKTSINIIFHWEYLVLISNGSETRVCVPPHPNDYKVPEHHSCSIQGRTSPTQKKSSNPSIKIFLNVVRVEFKLEKKIGIFSLVEHFPWWRCFVKVLITLTQKRRDLYLLFFSFGLTGRDYFKEIFPSKAREKKHLLTEICHQRSKWLGPYNLFWIQH